MQKYLIKITWIKRTEILAAYINAIMGAFW